MEALDDSNCPSLSDSFSLYERYMRSFNVVDSFLGEIHQPGACDQPETSNAHLPDHNICEGNVDLTTIQNDVLNKVLESPRTLFASMNEAELNINEFNRKSHSIDEDLYLKPVSPCTLLEAASLLDNSSNTEENSLIDKLNLIDVPASSEDSKSDNSKHPKPVFITSVNTMDNSNNAVDGVPMFRDKQLENVFKLPTTELSFNGTIKHVQKLKPMVDPLSALTSSNSVNNLIMTEKSTEEFETNYHDINSDSVEHKSGGALKTSESDDQTNDNVGDEASESTGDSQYQEFHPRAEAKEEENSSRWNSELSYTSFEASFDSGVRSPDVFSDNEECLEECQEDYWHFINKYEAFDKVRVRKMEETLQGVLPPPSITIIKTDVTEMLKKYYTFLPAFSENANQAPEIITTTPTKRTSLVQITSAVDMPEPIQETADEVENTTEEPSFSINPEENEDMLVVKTESENNTSSKEESVELKMCTETEAKETTWPDILKFRHHGIHYNLTKYSARLELLALKCGERFVGAETDSTVTVFSGGLQSPSSASKLKAIRLKMSQTKSPGRRLSHLARRRQAFCSAATISEKAQTSTSKMVLIDRNFFPHRKLINSADRKSPRFRNTPGKKTPKRRTPGKKTPNKTPKTKSGGSSRKKAMRRLLLDSDSLTRSQPTRDSSRRALFISPEGRKPVPSVPSTSVPAQAMRSKRALFGSPVRPAETKSLDGSSCDQFLKRKRNSFEAGEDRRSKIAKSLSFGGDTLGGPQAAQLVSRRASEMFANRSNMADLDEHQRQKLLWAVSEALRIHGWRMQSPGFREKASALAQLTRRLLTLEPHKTRLNAPKLSTSETMLKIARQYVFAIIKGRSVEDCFEDELSRLANEGSHKVSGYLTASAYQQFKASRQAAQASTSQIKENSCKQDPPKSASKNILQDKIVNIDASSNSSGLSLLDKHTGLYKSNSMPSFEDAAKMRARRQISFDNIDFPKR